MYEILSEVYTLAVLRRDGSLEAMTYPGMDSSDRFMFATSAAAVAYLERFWEGSHKRHNVLGEPVVVRGTL